MNNDIENELERLHLEPKWRGRYWHIHCPFHEDRNKSAVCFADGWICCFAGCKRQHINKLSGKQIVSYNYEAKDEDKPEELQDFTDLWLDLELLPEEGNVKGVSNKTLNKLGWRKWEGGFGCPAGIFIPYFSPNREKVRFFQIRHTEGDRRFTFAKGCSPICYGLEVLPKCKDYLCFTEGSRDSVILRMCGVPAVAIPSASSGAMLKRMEKYCEKHNLTLVCVGDRDEAGDKLIQNIDGFYIDARTPVGKDIGDFYEQKGLEEVKKYYEVYRSKS